MSRPSWLRSFFRFPQSRPVSPKRIRLEELEIRAVPAQVGLTYQIGSSIGDEEGHSVATDSAGNVYAAGFFGGTVDFDPGPGVFNFTSNSQANAYLTKVDPAGNLIWAKQFGGGVFLDDLALTVDANGNIYTAGTATGGVDFDPGPGVYHLNSGGEFVTKLNSAGNFVWARQFDVLSGGLSYAQQKAVSVDNSGNVYTTGTFEGTVDFDPGSSVFSITSKSFDTFVSKLDQAGNFVWAKSFGGTVSVNAGAIAVDALGDVYSTGFFNFTADFDPGPSVYNLSGNGDAYISKLDPDGNFVWAKQFNGDGVSAGNGLALDAQGNVCIVGVFSDTADFDPGPGVFNLSCADDFGVNRDTFVTKLDSAGNFIWASQMGGLGQVSGNALALDKQGNVYTTGTLKGTADFDSGAGTFNLTSSGTANDAFVSKLDSAGNFQWAERFGGTTQVTGNSVAADLFGNVYSTGTFSGTADFDPEAGVLSLTSLGGGDAYVSKLIQAGISGRVWDDQNGNGIRDNGEPFVAGAVAELLDSNGKSLGIQITGADGVYSFITPPASAGGYAVRFRTPTGFVFTSQDQGGDDSRDSDADATGLTALFPLGANEQVVRDVGLTGASPAFGFADQVDDNHDAQGEAATTDAAGNVYITGAFTKTADFDPGPGDYSLTSEGDVDAYVAKYSAAGALVWAKTFGGMFHDFGYAVAVDSQGNVYTTGNFAGTADFDPGAGTFNLTGAGNQDIYVSKLDSAGNFVWARQLGGASDDRGQGVATDAAGNVYTTGYFTGTADFDPGVGTFNLTAAVNGGSDAYVSKLDPAGNFVWARVLNSSTSASGGLGLTTDRQGNVITTGFFGGMTDFDPGAGTFTLISAGSDDSYVSKLDPAGNFVWARQLGGTATEQGFGVATDAQGNIITTGFYDGTADFDPGAGTFNLTNDGGDDAYVSKLDPAGNFVWAKQLGGTSDEFASGVATDSRGNVFTIGHFQGTTDFDPGAEVFNLTSDSSSIDAYISELDSSGKFVLARRLGGTSDDYGYGVATDGLGGVIATGTFSDTTDFDPSNASFPLTGAGNTNAFVAKLTQATVSGVVWDDQNGNSVQDFNEPPVAGAVVELLDGNGKSLGVQATGADGKYSFIAPPDTTDSGYQVQFRPPVGFGFSPTAGENDAIPSTGRTAAFTLAGNQAAVKNAGLSGAAPSFGFALNSGGTDLGQVVATDAAGNVYTTGSFRTTADFDPSVGDYTLTNAGGDDIFVAKYTAAGALIWARRFGSATNDNGLGVTTDAAGNVYVTGDFSGTVDFDPSPDLTTNLTSAGGFDAFVMKLDANGNLVWARQLGGTASDIGRGVAVDGLGDVYTTGRFTGSGDFDPGAGISTLTGSGSAVTSAYVSKLDANGNLIWAKQFIGSSNLDSVGVALDGNGNVYTAGVFAGTADFNPDLVGTFNQTSAGNQDSYVSKLDSAGNFVWARCFGGSIDDVIYGMTADAAGNVYATGYFSGTVDFDPDPTGVFDLTSAGNADAFVLKWNSAGQFDWANQISGTDLTFGYGVATDNRGNVYTTGTFNSVLSVQVGSSTQTFTPAGSLDAYVTKLDAAGNFVLVKQLSGTGDEQGFGVAADDQGDVYTAGSFSGTADFDPDPNTSSPLTSVNNAFVSKLTFADVTGIVWDDQNGNGIRDLNEPGVANATVELYDSTDGLVGDGDDILLESVTTDANGAYRFRDPVRAGSRYIRVSPPTGTAGNNPAYLEPTIPSNDNETDNYGRTAIFDLSVNPVQSLNAGLRTVSTTTLAWAIGGAGTDSAKSVTTDAAGNTYIVGSFSGTADFDPDPGVSALTSSSSDGYVAKYDPAGQLLWVKSMGGSGDDQASGVAIDANGAVVVTGTFTTTATFGATMLTSAGGTDAFVTKLDSSGVFLWAQRFGGAGDDTGVAVAVDAQNSIQVAGTFTGDANIGGTAFTNPGGSDAFVVKLNPDGSTVTGTARQLGGAGTVTVSGIAVNSGGVYVSGSFTGTADFNPFAGTQQFTSFGGSSDAFVVRLNATSFGWAKQFGAGGADTAQGITLDPTGNVLFTGGFQGTVDFDSVNHFNLTSHGGSADAYVGELTALGNFVWVKSFGGSGADTGTGVAVDARGYVYATGSFTSDADFNTDNPAGFHMVSAGATDGFVAKLTSSGQFVLADRLGGAGSDNPAAIAVHGQGDVTAVGGFGGTADLDLGVTPFLLTASGATDGFVSKLQEFTIQGRVWDDLNANGVQDSGEPELTDATVELYDSVDGIIGNGNDVLLNSVTTFTGGYQFFEPPDSFGYYVRFSLPQNQTSSDSLPVYVATLAGQGTNSAQDSDIDGLGQTGLVRRTQGPIANLGAGYQESPLVTGGWGLGGGGSETSRAVTKDDAGNIYVTGQFEQSVDFDPRSTGNGLASEGAADGFVAKYDPTGHLLWTRRLGGAGADEGDAITTDASGNVLVTGIFSGSADFGPNSPTLTGHATGPDVYILKLTSDGDFVWVRQIGGAKSETVTGISVDTAGNVLTTGTFAGTADFNPDPKKTANLTSTLKTTTGKPPSIDIFLSKLTKDGNYVWASKIGGTSDDLSAGVATDAQGNVYFNGKAFAADLDPGTKVRNVGGAFVSKYDTTGKFVWADESDPSLMSSITVTNDAVYTVGSELWKHTLTGTDVWRVSLAGNQTAVATDGSGNILTAGSFTGTVDFDPGAGTFPITSNNTTDKDAVVSKFDGNGNFINAESFGGSSDDTANGVTVTAGGTAFVTGSFQATADFDISSSVQSVTSEGGADAFVWKVPAGGISGHVWHDSNGNGLRDSTEPNEGGALVSLYRSTNAVIGDGDDVLIGTQVTAADGTYHFAAPTAGPGYYIRVQPSVAQGLTFTAQNHGGNNLYDSDVNAQGASSLFMADAAVPTMLDAGTAGAYQLFGAAWTTTGSGSSEVLASATDAAGNVYVTGDFKGTVDFDAGPGVTTLTSASAGNNGFVAKYTPAGILLWARRFQGNDDVGGQGIAVDETGNVYVTGRFKGNADFFDSGTGVFAVSKGYDAFVTKLDPTGTTVWARQFGDIGDDYGNGIAVGGGKVVFTGSFKGSVDFDPGVGVISLNSFGSQDAYVSALTTDGNALWAQRVGGANGDDLGRGVALDASGAVYVAGSFSGTADFDPSTVVLDETSNGLRDAFVWKLDKNGNVAWATHAGGPENDDATGVAVDSAGHVYAVGSFSDTADFDPGLGLLEVQSTGATDAFVWQLTPAGAPVWAKTLGGIATDDANAVAADATGVYVAGSFQQTADFDPGAGQLQLVSAGGEDGFVAKLDPSGNRQWAHRIGGDNDDTAQGVAVDSAGRVTFAGAIYNQGTFDPGDGDQSLTGGPATSLFAGRIDQTPAGGAYPLDAFEPNSEASAATDLGVINVHSEIDGLSLSSSHDEDWFRFDLLSASEAANQVRIDIAAGHGNVVLELYRDGGLNPLQTLTIGDDSSDTGVLSLAGLTPDSYLIRVSGAANPAYKLTLDVPKGFAKDADEPNDTSALPTDLGALWTPSSFTGLSINTPGDEDWFAFDTVAVGTLSSEVRIDFRNALGDLDLQLFDGNGNLLRTSAGLDDSESINLAGLPADHYLVRVSGHDDAINPAYTLTVRPPLPLIPDVFETGPNNNTRLSATNLGVVNGEQSWNNLSIDSSADEDWFKFSTSSAGLAGHLAAIDFVNTEGDLDLRLYDTSGALISASTGNTDTEQTSLQGLAAGTYYLRVSGFSGATQPSYNLRIVAPEAAILPDRLESTGGNQTRQTASVVQTPGQTKLVGSQSLVDLSLTGTDTDWYRFTTVGKGTAQHDIVMTYPAANGTLGLELYNAAGAKIATSTGANGNLVVSLKGLAAGTYYARTFIPKGGSTGSDYQLTFDAPGSSAAVAPDDWTVMVYMTADTLAERAFNDINEMEAAVAKLPGTVNISVLWDQSANEQTYPTGNNTQKAWSTAGMGLISPDTNPNQIATNFQILPEKDTGDPATLKSFVDWTKLNAPANHYALIFWDHGDGLRGFNFDTQDGQAPDHLTTSEVVNALTGEPKLDLIAFDACFMGVTETAYNLRDVTDVVVASQEAVPGDGFEYDTVLAALQTNPAAVTAENLATGMVQSYGERYGSTGRSDTLSAVRTSDLTGLAAALGDLSAAIDAASQSDKLKLVSIAAQTLLPDEDADEQRDLGSFLSGVIADGTLSTSLRTAATTALNKLNQAVLSRTSDLRNSSGLSVYLPVSDQDILTIDPTRVSNYGTEYAGFDIATSWLTMLSQLKEAADGRPNDGDYDDKAGNNDSKATATDLQLLGSSGISRPGLSLNTIDDQDWYRFQVNSPGSTLEADITVGGSLPILAELRDSNNNILAQSVSNRIRLDNLSAGTQTYYLHFHANTEIGNYGFTISPPAAAADLSGNNTSPDKTYVLQPQIGTVYAGYAVAGVVAGVAGQDWLQFNTTALPQSDLRRVSLTISGGQSVEAQIRNSAGYVVSSATGTGTLLLPYTQSGNAESYTLVISNPNASAVSYSLRLDSATKIGATYPLERFDLSGAFGTGTDWSVTGAMNVVQGQLTINAANGQALRTADTPLTDTGVQANFQLPTVGKPTVSVLARTNLTNGKLTAYEARLELYKGVITAKLYRTVNGVSSLLTYAAGPKVTGGVLRLEVQGQFLRLLVNGNQYVEFTDTQVLPAGRTGFAGTTGVVVDDFQASAIDVPLPVSYQASSAGLGSAWQAVAGKFTAQDGKFVAATGVAATALYTPARVADVLVTANYSLQAAGQSIGVIARHNGAAKGSYYEAQVTEKTTGVFTATLLRYVNGAAKAFATITTGITSTGTLGLEVRGDQLRLLINGVAQPVSGTNTVVIDKSILLAGRAGIYATGNVALTNFNITPLAPRFADNFNRADNTSLGAAWNEQPGGNLRISGGQLTADGDGVALAVQPSLADVSVSARFDFTQPGQHTVGLIARYFGGNYYEGRLTKAADGSLTATIQRLGASPKLLKTLKFTKATAGVLQFDVEGSTLKLSLFGESISATDTTLAAAGLTGIHLGSGDSIDDFNLR
ncbi:SBBP repeat-containing protein [Zavarzinella formosa]|uniref:SBBP repeat-containing protein n=1 Tax=Zavarzinella formosa TaxID=360055 RepID=UPI00031043A6|nr:SBBP repeat-containing protein [Zavarzinella formosa]